MPVLGTRRPPAPTCEDYWEEDTQEAFTDARAPANSAVKRSKSSELDPVSPTEKKNHDGSDSGYSSKAGTSDSMSTASMKKPGDLRGDPRPMERERQPYVYAPARAESARTSPTKAKAVKMEKPTRSQPQQRFQHPQGMCWVCDQYGFHFDLEKEIQRPATTAPTQKIPKSPLHKPRSKEESDSHAPSHRRSSSSRREGRPLTMYATGPYGFGQQPVDYTHPLLAANGWQVPQDHVTQYPQHQYPYGTPNLLSSSYTQPQGMFDISAMPAMQFTHPAEHFYADTNYKNFNGSTPFPNPSKYEAYEADAQRGTARGSRPREKAHKSSKTAAEADRISMPPPPRPHPSRPVIKKTTTDYPSVSTRRTSVYTDDEEFEEFQAALAKERTSSRPPSSYKVTPGGETHGRPQPRKSVSYSTSSGTLHVASSHHHRDIPRRSTDPPEARVTAAEEWIKATKQRDAEIENHSARSRKSVEVGLDERSRHQTKRESLLEDNGYTANRILGKPFLTADALKKMEQSHSSGVSDAGSVRSKHSSRDSASGRVRAGTAYTSNPRTNITMDNGISLSIPADYGDTPLDIMVGNIRLSMNPSREEEPPYRELRRIERAPSEASQTSRKSMNGDSATNLAKTREDLRAMAKQKQSANSSKRSSRATSSARADTRREHAGSIDYSVFDDLDEKYYLEYSM